MKVLLDGRVEPGLSGGVYQVVRSLAGEFAENPDPTVDITLLANPGSELTTLGLPVAVPAGRSGSHRGGIPWRAAARRVPGAQWAHRVARVIAQKIDDPPIDVGAYDVVHLALQRGFSSSRPTVFSPYDLQHEHLPEMFDAVARRDRRFRYRELARRADAVVVMSSWTAHDVVEQLDVEQERIFVVPLGVSEPAPAGYADPVDPPPLLGLTPGSGFALYPAQTWPHKNHLGLGRALQHLRASGVDVPVVCPGYLNEHHRHIEAQLAKMGVDDLMVFPGYVSDRQMEALYGHARMLIFPSLFEGWGMPIFDAMARGLPVACSDVCGLGVTTDGAAQLFDPLQPEALAAAVATVWADESVRAQLRACGLQVAARYTWAETCTRLRAIYKLVAGADLSEVDGDALARARSWQRERSP